VNINGIGVVGAACVLLAVAGAGGVEDLDPGDLAVIAAELEHVIRAVDKGGVLEQAVVDVAEIHRVRSPHVVLAGPEDGIRVHHQTQSTTASEKVDL